MNLKRAIIITAIVTILYMVIIHFYSYYIEPYIFGELPVNTNQLGILRSEKIAPIITIIWGVVIAPVIEEIFYRQILFGVLYDLHEGCNKYVRFITASLVSSIAFSLIHYGAILSPYTISYTMYGILFSSIYVYTKRLSCSIFGHGLINFILHTMRLIG